MYIFVVIKEEHLVSSHAEDSTHMQFPFPASQIHQRNNAIPVM